MIKNLGQVAAIYVGKTAPRNVNMIWLDNTVIPYVFKSYNGEEWTEIPTGAWVETYVNGWLVSLQQGSVTTDDDYVLINSRGVNYRMTVKDFVKSSVGNPLDFKGVIRTDSDFPNPSTLEGGDMYIIITEPAGGTVTDPYSGKTFSDSEKIVWDSVINSWASLGKIDVKVDLSTTYSATEVTIHSSAGKETTVVGVTDDNAGVMVPVQKKWLDALSNGSTLTPQGPLTAPYHKHRYSDIVDRIISQQVTGDSAINPMSQKATTEALDLKLDKTSVLQVSGVSTIDVMSQKAVTDAIQTLKSNVDDKLSRYLPLSGGTMTGTIKLATNNVHIEGLGQDGTTTYHILSLDAANRPTFGSSNVGVVIQTKTENILHKKDSGTFIVHDTSNLPDPAKLSADQTFTGTNNFTAGKFQVGAGSRFRVDSIANLDIDGIVSGGWTKELSFHSRESSSSDTIKRGAFGIKADGATESLSTDYFYLTLGDSTWSNAEYKFFNNTLKVPNTWYLQNSGGYQFVAIDSDNVRLGSSNLLTILRSSNSDLTHRKYTASSTYTDYKIWDESNLPSPASSGDLANYLPLVGGVLSGSVYLKNNVKLNSYKTDGTAINLISENNSNNTIIGNGSPTRIYTSDSDLMHYIGSTGYKIYDSHNLPNPVQTSDLADYVVKSDLDAYATKAELGDYATKQWVTDNFSGGGSGADLLPSDNTWSGTNTYTKNIVLNNNVSLASNKTDGSLMNIASINTSDVLALGNIGLDVKISSSYSDLIHKKSSGEYKIWDAYNVSRPLDYVNGTARSVTSVYTRNLNLNGTNYPFIGTGTSVVTLFAPTDAGTSGQILQSQGAGKAPIWVDGGAGGGVQLSDNNTWTGLNTFQGGLKTSDGTNSYDVWDKNNLKYVARITPADIGYALSFYTTTAGWRDFDDLAINNLTPKGLKTIAQGGIGYVGTYDSAFASAEIKDIVTQNVYGFDGKNLSNASTGASFLGNESNAFKSAHIGEVNTNTVKSADGKSLLNFKTDGVYMIANSGTEYKLATLNDIGGGGSSVSLDGSNTWTGVNIFSGTGLVTNQYDSGNTEIPATASYSIRLACGGSYDNYGFGAVRSENRVKQSYAFVQTPSAFFTFDNSGSLYTTIGNTKYEFWNKQNLAKPIVYNTNSDGDSVLYKGDSTANRIDSLELVGILPPTNNAVTLSNGGTGGFGNVDNAYAEAYIGNVHANNVTTATIVVPGSENYFEFKEDGLHFYDIVNQEEYKINMTKV